MPSSVRPRGSGSGGRAPPVTPMSERQQMALLMQMTSSGGNQTGSRSPSGTNAARSRDRNERGETPLHLAAIKGDVEQVNKLLAHRVDPNVADFAGWTPLHEACNHGWFEVAQRLVQAGAQVNARGLDDDTPLHDAASNGHVRLVRMLVERGADVNARNRRGKTPCDVAAANVLPYMQDNALPAPQESGPGARAQPRPRDEKKVSSGDSSSSGSSNTNSKKCTSPMDSVETLSGGGSKTAATGNVTNNSTTAANTATPPDDVYEFKSVKETGSSSTGETSKAAGEAMDTHQSEANDPLNTSSSCGTGSGGQSSNNPDESSTASSKRTFGEMGEGSEESTPDDETRRKKRKDSDGTLASGKDGGKGGAQQQNIGGSRGNVGQTGKVANKAGGAGNTGKSSNLAAGSKTNNGSGSNSAADRKSPCPSPKPASSVVSDNTDNTQDDTRSSSDLKVPPLKIVIPQGSAASAGDQDPGSGGSRNGKSGSQRHHHTHQALPYVVTSGTDASSTGPTTNITGDKDTAGNNTANISNPSDGNPISGQSTASGNTNQSSGKSGDEKKDSFAGNTGGDEQKSTGGHHQRVLRSSHRSGGTGSNAGPGGGGANTDRSSNNSSPLLQRSHSPSPNSSPAAGQVSSGQSQATGQTNTQQQHTENSGGSGKDGGSAVGTTATGNGAKPASNTPDTQASTSADTDSSSSSTTPTSQPSNTGGNTNNSSSSNSGNNTSTVELHPRKRKMRPNKETPASGAASQPHHHHDGGAGGGSGSNDSSSGVSGAVAAEVHPHEQPITNCYQLYLNIRKQIERRRKSLFPVQPKPPQGFKDYLMNRCTYVLAGTAPAVPNVTSPASLPPLMKELFTEQEKERYRLRMQHVVEKEKLVLSVEQEILRVHGRAARALANQSLPFSVCTVLRDEEVYNIITPEQEEKDRNARSRYNGRLFLSWLQDVDDKWEKIKEHMLLRHHNEAESLHAVQRMDWEWKLKELSLCEFKATPEIDDVHVPMVHVSDDFDLLPA